MDKGKGSWNQLLPCILLQYVKVCQFLNLIRHNDCATTHILKNKRQLSNPINSVYRLCIIDHSRAFREILNKCSGHSPATEVSNYLVYQMSVVAFTQPQRMQHIVLQGNRPLLRRPSVTWQIMK